MDIKIKDISISLCEQDVHISQGGYESIVICKSDLLDFIDAFKKINGDIEASQPKKNGYKGLT